MALALSESQLNAMQTTERVASIFSLLAILFILSTFLLAHGFDKPINRLIFFASFSNFGMCITTFISLAGPLAGPTSALCQFQAWAVQMFLGVDVFWALCMSLNVYLALFKGWTAKRMRAQEWKYFVACYGASLIPAVVYLFVKTERRGRVYGPALLWCWITPKWEWLRMVTLYGIVWAALLFAFGIYCAAIAKVWRNRRELAGLFNPFNEDPFRAKVTTDIVVEHEEAAVASPQSNKADYFGESIAGNGESPRPRDSEEGSRQRADDQYTVNIRAAAAERRPSRPDRFHVRTITRDAALQETNADAWLYARAAFLFFCALLISWIPASINRLYSLIRPDSLVYGLNWLACFVLPLQGFLNCIVYVITSQTAVKNLYRSMVGKQQLTYKDEHQNHSGLDAPSGERGVKGMSMHLGRVASRLGHRGTDDTRTQMPLGRRLSEKAHRQRLDSDVSDVQMLETVHVRSEGRDQGSTRI